MPNTQTCVWIVENIQHMFPKAQLAGKNAHIFQHHFMAYGIVLQCTPQLSNLWWIPNSVRTGFGYKDDSNDTPQPIKFQSSVWYSSKIEELWLLYIKSGLFLFSMVHFVLSLGLKTWKSVPLKSGLEFSILFSSHVFNFELKNKIHHVRELRKTALEIGVRSNCVRFGLKVTWAFGKMSQQSFSIHRIVGQIR